MIVHYSVIFQNASKGYLYNNWIVSVKKFKAIASVVLLVGIAKIANGFLAIFM